MRRPELIFHPPVLHRIVAKLNVVPIGEIIMFDGAVSAHWTVDLAGLSRAPRRAANAARAKREMWLLASEWFVAAGILDPEVRLRCADQDVYARAARELRRAA